MNNNYISFSTKYELQPSFDDERFTKIRIYAMADQENLNRTFFGMDAIEKAKNSIVNTPILAYIRKENSTNADFGGHDVEYKINTATGDTTVTYLERPIGIIPESNNNYHYETIDGKTFVVVDGYIWNEYNQQALEILKRDNGKKGHSMEICVKDAFYNDEDDLYHITDYMYLGFTVLGDDVTPAITGSHVRLLDDNYQFDSKYLGFVKELNKKLKSMSTNDDKHTTDNKDNKGSDEMFKDSKEKDSEEVFEEEVKEEVFEEEVKEEDFSSVSEFVNIISQRDNEIFELKQLVKELNIKIVELNDYSSRTSVELDELREYKLKAENEKLRTKKEGIFLEYSRGLTEDEMREVYDNIDQLTDIEIENKLNSILSKKVLNSFKKDEDIDTETFKMAIPKRDKSKNKYAL